MSGFSVVMLICSLALAHEDCQINTAYDVVRGPRVESALMCAMAGQTMIAATAIAPRAGQDYLKVMCVASRPLAASNTKLGPADQ